MSAAHVVVNGHEATVTDTSTTRCVTWSPDGRSGLQVCSDSAHASPEHPVSVNELLRMARSIH